MSNTVSSASLILRRVAIYLQDINHILHHEIPENHEKMEIVEQISTISQQLEEIRELLNG